MTNTYQNNTNNYNCAEGAGDKSKHVAPKAPEKNELTKQPTNAIDKKTKQT